MKKIIVSLALAISSLCATAQAKTFVCNLSFQYVGSNMATKLSVDASTGQVQSRSLPGGMQLVRMDSVVMDGNQANGRIRILNYTMPFRGTISVDTIALEMYSSKTNSSLGSIVGGPKTAYTHNLVKATDSLLSTLRSHIFDVNYLKDSAWLAYEKNLKMMTPMLQDDLELIGLANRGVDKLPFTHYNLGKMTDAEFNSFLQRSYESPTPAKLEDLGDKTAMLTVESFGGDGKSVEAYMQQVIAGGYDKLIIDLRSNTGGGAGATLALGKYLSAKAQVGGALLTNKYFAQKQGLPNAADYASFRTFDGGSTTELIRLLKTEPGVVLTVPAASKVFTGKVIILTSTRTASACEPFVYGMQRFKRATIVGENTAGSMLSKIPFNIGQGFMLYLPISDYYTIDGYRLDKKGVAPCVAVPAKDALATALTL